MKVLFAASECTPFVKTGGLADVIGTLPNALTRAGADVRVILPKYRDIPRAWKEKMSHLTYFYVNLGWRKQYCGIDTLELNGVTYYFVDNEFYFARDSVYGSGNEEGERFGYFCRAVLEALNHIGFKPDILHCNDWQTGMIPVLLSTQYGHNAFYKDIKTVYTIHNLRFQGVFPWTYIDDLLGIGEKYFAPDYLEYYGSISFMKGGIVFSDLITTVSPTYALEIQNAYYGERMEGLIRARKNKLVGILNGIDPAEYDPQTDRYLVEHFSTRSLAGKAACKRQIQEELGLDIRPDVPLIAMVTRLTDQKGLDLVECVLDDILRSDVQLAVLGKGEERYGELLSWAAWRYQGRMAACIEINEALAHRLYAAADIFLMPSQFEPCGLSQMLAMRYGTIPVVRETGGLHDSVTPYNKYSDDGNGFSFANYNAHEMLFTIERAVEYFRDRPLWERMMRRAMKTNFSWDNSARQYLEFYAKLADKTLPKQTVKELVQEAQNTVEIVPTSLESAFKAVRETPEAIQAAPEAAPEVIEEALQPAGEIADETHKIVPDQVAADGVRKKRAKKAAEETEAKTNAAAGGKTRSKKAAKEAPVEPVLEIYPLENAPPQKRGRKPKEKSAEAAAPIFKQEPAQANEIERTIDVPAPKKRGRKPKVKSAEATPSNGVDSMTDAAAPKKRGRKPKEKTAE